MTPDEFINAIQEYLDSMIVHCGVRILYPEPGHDTRCPRCGCTFTISTRG